MDYDKFTTQLLDIKNKHAQELSAYRQQFDNADFHMLQHVIEYAKMSVKALFLLNGTAAVSVLTLFTSSSLGLKKSFIPLLNSVTSFSWGAICSVICILLAYIAQKFYQNECACMGRSDIIDMHIRHLYDEKLFLIEEKNIRVETKNNLNKEIDNLSLMISKKTTEKAQENKKEKILGRCGDIFTGLEFCTIILSLFLFSKGVDTAKNGFNDEVLNINLKEQQIQFQNNS